MKIVLDKIEQEVIEKYAKQRNLTYGETLQKIIDAMQKGLNEINMPNYCQ